VRRGAAEGSKNFPVCLQFFYIKKCKKAALKKIERNCLVFANSRWEVLFQATGQPLATAERKVTWKSSKAI
jgi:hypothetical protein